MGPNRSPVHSHPLSSLAEALLLQEAYVAESLRLVVFSIGKHALRNYCMPCKHKFRYNWGTLLFILVWQSICVRDKKILVSFEIPPGPQTHPITCMSCFHCNGLCHGYKLSCPLFLAILQRVYQCSKFSTSWLKLLQLCHYPNFHTNICGLRC